MGENLKLGFIILLAGIVTVFCVLILLIGIIKLYSELVVTIQNTFKKKFAKKKKRTVTREELESVTEIEPAAVTEAAVAAADEGEIPLEIIAAIAAAVEAVFGEGNVRVKSVKRSSKRRSAWKSAGMAENTRSF